MKRCRPHNSGVLKLALSAAAAGAFAMRAGAEIQYDTVALSGPAGSSLGVGPGEAAGVHFDVFRAASLNDAGQVAFYGTLNIPSMGAGIWTSTGGALTAAARTRPAQPGPNLGPGVGFASLVDPAFNSAGRVAFVASLAGESVDSENDFGLFSNVGGAPAVVAREGPEGPGPNAGPGVYFRGMTDTPAMNASGAVAFRGTLQGAGVDLTNSEALFSTAGGTLTMLARNGSAGPGPNQQPGEYFTAMSNPVLNDAGTSAFRGFLAGPGVNLSNHSGIFTTPNGVVTAVARAGPTGPGPNLGPDVHFATVSTPLINAAGEVAFRSDLAGAGVNSSNDQGVFTTAGGTLHAVARVGTGGPGPNLGPGAHFGSLGDPVINSAGELAFRAGVFGNGVDSTNGVVLVSTAGGSLAVVARQGAPGPGPDIGGGVTFADFGNEPVINAAGEIAFVGILSGPGVNTSNDRGIFTNAGVAPGGTLLTVVREGDAFDVDPGAPLDLRTISGFSFTRYAGGEDGRPTGFNDSGMLAFVLTFTDGSSGVFTAVVPEPATGFAMLVPAAAALLRRRGRAR